MRTLVTLATLTLRSVLRCFVMTLILLAGTASAQITHPKTNIISPITNYESAATPNVVSPSHTKINFEKGNCNDKTIQATHDSAIPCDLSASSRRTVL
jgi:hypothetical protein